MNQETAIRMGITIDRECPGISQTARVLVAEILACSSPNPDIRAQQRRAKLDAAPLEQRERIRDYVNRIIRARARG